MNLMPGQKKKSVLIIYIIVFYFVWTVFEFFIKDAIDSLIPNNVLSQIVKSGIIKNLVWTVPAFILISKFCVCFTLKEMFTTKVNALKYLPLFILFTVYLLIGAIWEKGELVLAKDFGADEIIIVLFVGLTEEMVFRGWLLNATITKENKWKCIILNAVMFLAIHFPSWIYNGVFIRNFEEFGFVSVVVLSAIFSLTFMKSRNILIPITLHMHWDLLMFMFY